MWRRSMATNDEIILILKHHGGLLEDLHVVVLGDGKPEEGLAFRVAFLERFQVVIKRAIWIVIGALLTGGVAYFIFR